MTNSTGRRCHYVVRDQDEHGCGHRHRSLETAIKCLTRQRELADRWGPTGARYKVWAVGSSVIERTVVGL